MVYIQFDLISFDLLIIIIWHDDEVLSLIIYYGKRKTGCNRLFSSEKYKIYAQV